MYLARPTEDLGIDSILVFTSSTQSMRTQALVVAVGETGHNKDQVLRKLTLGSTHRECLTMGRYNGWSVPFFFSFVWSSEEAREVHRYCNNRLDIVHTQAGVG